MPRFDLRICAKAELSKTVHQFAATHVISILTPGDSVTRPAAIRPANHLRVRFADEEDPKLSGAPSRDDVAKILDFAMNLPNYARLVVHCDGGVCRSTAAALAILVQQQGVGADAVRGAMRQLVAIRSQACPNMLVARHADALLGAEGRLIDAADRQAQRRAAFLMHYGR